MKNQTPFNLALVLSLVTAMVLPAAASPLVSIGDNADLYFNGSTSLQWSSNVFRDETDERDDLMWSVRPGFELNLGRGLSQTNFSVITSYEFRRYFDLDELDTELFNIEANGSYRSSRLDLSGSVYFREEKTSAGDVNYPDDLVESDNIGGQLNSEYRFSPKFSFGAGFIYSEKSYKEPFNDRLSDQERFSIPFDIFYELTPKVDLSVGYTYGQTDVGSLPPYILGTIPPTIWPGRNGYTTEDHYFNVGARGNLLPKLTGFFKVGYRTRDTDLAGSDSDSTLGFNADLTWATTPKLTNRLGLSRDFGVGGEGNSTENTTVSWTSSYSINNYYAATAFVDYTLRDYVTDRKDNQYRLGARLTYTPNQYWRFGAGYTYSENDSDSSGIVRSGSRSYIDHTVDISASLRY